MTAKRFRKGKSILTDFPTGAIIDKKTGERYYDGIKPSYISSKELVKILNELHEENERLREHFIYLIGTALEDKECRKIYAKGLLEIFDNCSNLDEAKNKIKEYLE